MNELPLGLQWPPHSVRLEMLKEALTIIRLLWSKKRITYRGKYYKLSRATLYTKPKVKIPIFIAGTGPKIARLAGEMGDGFITVPHIKYDVSKVMSALSEGAKAVGKDPNKIVRIMHMMVSYDEDYDEALNATKPWSPALLPALYKYGVYDPVEMEENGNLVGREARAKLFLVITKAEQLIKRLEEFIRRGFTRFQFNNSSPEPPRFLEMAGRGVIPYLKEEYKDE